MWECNGFGLARNTEKQSSTGQVLGEKEEVILERKNFVKQLLWQGAHRNERKQQFWLDLLYRRVLPGSSKQNDSRSLVRDPVLGS